MSKEEEKKIEKLKAIFPGVIDESNCLNVELLKEEIGLKEERKEERNKGYELIFAGKEIAKEEAIRKTKKELKVEKEQSKYYSKTNNVIIRGDNLEVLKVLKENYYKKIKMIYIDPPYNSGKKFIYKDDFKRTEKEIKEGYKIEREIDLRNIEGTKNHSGWLSFMYSRLQVARDLLKEEGVIFISIDDKEIANLKIICNEIFEEENFVGTFCWTTKKAAQGMVRKSMLVTNHEYILVYSKNKKKFRFLGIERKEEGFSNPDKDLRGLWKRQYLQRLGQGCPVRTIKDPVTGKEYSFETPYSQEKLNKWVEEKVIIFPNKKSNYPVRKEFIKEYKQRRQLVTFLDLFPTKVTTEKLYKLFENKKVFTNPKPDNLLHFLIKVTTQKEDIIFDFFAGSGTTGEAVMQLNLEDGGRRKYILTQIDEVIKDKKLESYKFCVENKLEPVISSITIERMNRVGEKINKERKGREPIDIGYKVFSLRNKIERLRKTTEDKLINMMRVRGRELNEEIKEIKVGRIYKVKKEFYIIEDLTSKEIQEVIKESKDCKINFDGYNKDLLLEKYLNIKELKNKINVIY